MLQKEQPDDSGYSLSKKTYDKNLYEILKGEYSEELLHELFVEQQGVQPKRSMYDFVKDHKVYGIPLFKESEVERLIRQNYQNSLISEVPYETEQQAVDTMLWKQRVTLNMPQHKVENMADFQRTFQTELTANQDKIGLP